MNKSKKYSEIILLGQMLQERKIEHEQHDLYDGYQIIVPICCRNQRRKYPS